VPSTPISVSPAIALSWINHATLRSSRTQLCKAGTGGSGDRLEWKPIRLPESISVTCRHVSPVSLVIRFTVREPLDSNFPGR
jgi:hypothetical protein